MKLRSLLTMSAAIGLGACTGHPRVEPAAAPTTSGAYVPALLEPPPPPEPPAATAASPAAIEDQRLPTPSTRRRGAPAGAPVARVDAANRAAVREPSREGYVNAVQVYAWSEGALYRLYTAPERVSEIALQPNESLISVAAGDTVRWVIGDTTSGSAAARRTHILVKPSAVGLRTNLVITTDRRVYHVQVESTARTAMASISWTYPQDELLAVQRGEGAAEAAPLAGVSVEALNFGYRIEGDDPAWRPVRAFDDGSQVFIEFPSTLAPGRGAAPVRSRDQWPDRARQLPPARPLLCRRSPVHRRGAAARRAPAAGGAHRPRPASPPAPREALVTDDRYEGDSPAAPPKEDPETLVLRGAPRPVVRFRRGLIVGITGAVAAGLATVTWLALEPPSFRLAAEGDGGGDPLGKAAPEALANAPSSYGEVPQLGPPLPGDLGRPILEHQRSLAEPAPADTLGASAEGMDPAQAAEAERQRLAAAREAARASGVIVQLQSGSGGGAQARLPNEVLEGDPTIEPAPASLAGAHQPEGEPGSSAAGDTNPHVLRAAPSPWTLVAGTIIPASLITGLNSDLPGTVVAQVTENVRDSATGRAILVPQGTRLIGRYDSRVSFGQRRALLVWQRIVFPDGASIRLDDAPATDLAGYSGVEDGVDFHSGRLLKGIVLSTSLGVGTELSSGGSESELVQALRESTQQSAARAGDQITSRNLNVQPTLTVRPGWPVRAIIHKDLVLRPWRG